jgi:hypothetical protein
MTRNERADDAGDDLARRTLLRRAGAAVGTVGLGVVATPAEATSRCPRTRHYWAENDWPPHVDNNVDDPLELGGDSRSIAVWKLFLGSDQRGDRAAMFAQQLLTAKLNLLLRLDPDPACVNRSLDAYDDRTVEETRLDASRWLSHSNFSESAPQQCWTVETSDGSLDGEPLYEILARFNHNDLDELDCDCYGSLGEESSPPPLDVGAGPGTCGDADVEGKGLTRTSVWGRSTGRWFRTDGSTFLGRR